MDFRRLAPSKVRHFNRPEPAERIKCRCDIVQYDDGTVSFHYLTLAEVKRIRALAEQDVHLFPFCFALDAVIRDYQEQTA